MSNDKKCGLCLGGGSECLRPQGHGGRHSAEPNLNNLWGYLDGIASEKDKAMSEESDTRDYHDGVLSRRAKLLAISPAVETRIYVDGDTSIEAMISEDGIVRFVVMNAPSDTCPNGTMATCGLGYQALEQLAALARALVP